MSKFDFLISPTSPITAYAVDEATPGNATGSRSFVTACRAQNRNALRGRPGLRLGHGVHMRLVSLSRFGLSRIGLRAGLCAASAVIQRKMYRLDTGRSWAASRCVLLNRQRSHPQRLGCAWPLLSPEAARALVKRMRLPRQKANDGKVLVSVDLSEIHHRPMPARSPVGRLASEAVVASARGVGASHDRHCRSLWPSYRSRRSIGFT
jgi:hypothetical protein